MGVMVGRKAPDFSVPAVKSDGTLVDNFHFGSAIKGRYAVLFFYSLDFSRVCPSELIALNHRLDHFESRHVEVVAVSVDSHLAHYAWRNIPPEQGGIGHVGFTLASDLSHSVSRAFDVESEDGKVALRGTFLIDTEGVVRHQSVNDIPIGRSIDEILRVVDALQYHEEHGYLCPAGWNDGDAGIKDSPQGAVEYLKQFAHNL